jgi:hypothetical protein
MTKNSRRSKHHRDRGRKVLSSGGKPAFLTLSSFKLGSKQYLKAFNLKAIEQVGSLWVGKAGLPPLLHS